MGAHPFRLGVLVSGSGTNLQAILDGCAKGTIPAEVALVVSNRADAGALKRATTAGVATLVIPQQDYPNRDAFDQALIDALRSARVQLICCAGFMRILGKKFLSAFPGQVINIHPALLPAFPGVHGVRQALEYGARLVGATVHFVDEGTDTGPIIIQGALPVRADDTEASLSERVLHEIEHKIYPAAISWISQGRVRLRDRHVLFDGTPRSAPRGALFNPPLDFEPRKG